MICLQNHDQVGNRAFGERLHHQVDLAAYRAATTLLLCAPETPLLFMGQEWAASTPFLYFTDHPEALGRLVTEGRRREFSGFEQFRDPALRDRIPDPQAAETFEASRLRWAERGREPHASVLRLYEALLTLRRTAAALYDPAGTVRVEVLDDDTLALRRDTADQQHAVLAIVRLRGAGSHHAAAWHGRDRVARRPLRPGALDREPGVRDRQCRRSISRSRRDVVRVRFERPGAIVLTAPDSGHEPPSGCRLATPAREPGAAPALFLPSHHEVRSRHSKGAYACRSPRLMSCSNTT